MRGKNKKANNISENDLNKKRIRTISDYLKEEFGQKTIKLSIDGGFTCPNRDGTKGYGGCLFCSPSGSGDMASNIEAQIKLLSTKWPKAKYLAYFQNHTNTYAKTSVLRGKYLEVLNHKDISGIVISTRPDSITPETLDLLEELNKNHFLWMELGLQSIHSKTMKNMNLCYTLSDFENTLSELTSRNIKVVTHLILGLPDETKEDMIKSVKYLSKSDIWGIKLHLMNLVMGSKLAKKYPDYIPFSSIDEYVTLVCDILEILPQDIVIHRLTGDAPRSTLIEPKWSYKKRTILNNINKEMIRRNAFQGDKFEKL